MKRATWIGACLGAGLLIYSIGTLLARETVTVIDAGKTRVLETRAFTLRAALAEAGILLGAADLVDQPVDTWTWNLPDAVAIRRASQVTILDGDQKPQVRTSTAGTPADLLAEAGIRLNPAEDRLYVDGLESASPETPFVPSAGHVLQIMRALEITLDDDGQPRTIRSSAATLGEALWEAGIRPGPADVLDPAPETPLSSVPGGQASLRWARSVTILVGEQTLQIESAAATVGEALAEAGLPLQGLDTSQPPEDTPLEAGQTIRVTRVSEAVLVGQELLPFETEYELDPETELDHETVIQAGTPGLVLSRERVRYENGQETARTPLEEWQALEPQTELIGTGTKVVIHKEVVNGEEIEYWRKLTVYATSYSPCRVGGGRCDSGTASGSQVGHGTIATTVDWFLAMRGQGIYVPGYGTGYVADTGGGIPGRYWIDLGYSDADYISWHQWVTIYFLTPVPEYVPPVLYP